jgi:hypothetical protein
MPLAIFVAWYLGSVVLQYSFYFLFSDINIKSQIALNLFSSIFDSQNVL